MDAISNLSEEVCYLLRRVANQISRSRERASADSPAAGMGMILSMLAAGREMNQLELANALQIRTASLSEAIIKLDARGFITRRKNPLDRRITLVSLTEKGVAAERMLREERRRNADTTLSVLTEPEIEALYGLLHKLSIALMEGRAPQSRPQAGSELEELMALGERDAQRRRGAEPPRSRREAARPKPEREG